MKLLIESTTVLEGPPTESFKVLLKVMGILFSISEWTKVTKQQKHYLQNNDNLVLTIIRHMQTQQVRPQCSWKAITSSTSSYSVLQTAGRIFNFDKILGSYFMRITNVLLWAWACITFWVGVQCAALHRIVLIALLSLISSSSFWHFGCFSFRLWNSPWCVHIHATDQSVAMHRIRVVCIVLFVLCLVPVSERLASIGPLAENCTGSKLKSSHSMRRGAGRGAGRGKPDGLKRLSISLGFKCAHCRSEFDSLYAQLRRSQPAFIIVM